MSSRRRRRGSTWVDTLFDTTTQDGTPDVIDLMGSISTDEARGWTLVRTLVELAIIPAVPGAADGQQVVDLGLGVTSREAFLASAVPDPNVSGDQTTRGWVWRHRCLVLQDTAGALTPTICRGDFRSQRKLDERGNTFIHIMNQTTGGTAFSVVTIGLIRCLYLLP